ncbi:MAG: glycosyltransferase family 2 protein [Solirubrobacteraceae bacterium]
MTRAAAIVLSYDGLELLEAMLPSLLAQRGVEFSVLLVDNGSSDGTEAATWPAGIQVLRIERNIGVAAALNRGLESVGAACEYIALLNNDVELEPDWLARLGATLDAFPQAASATGKTLDYHARDTIDAAGDTLMWSGAATHRGIGERDVGQYDEPAAVFCPCAGVAVFRRSAFDVVGGFDEDFFAYQEDVDWGLRAQLAGFTARYEPSAVAYHMGGATTGRDQRRYGLLQRRNQILVPLKSFPLRALLRHAPKIVSYQAGWVVAAAHEGMLPEQLRALWAAILATPRTLRKRRGIERNVSLAYLDSVMTPVPYAGQGPLKRARGILSKLRR